MAKRVVVGVIGALFTLWVIYFAPAPFIPAIMTFFCVMATGELLGSTKIFEKQRIVVVACIFSALFPWVHYLGFGALTLEFMVCSAVLYGFFESYMDHKTVDFAKICQFLFAALIIPYFLTALMRIFYMENGQYFVVIPMVAAWCSDSCALFAGLLFGKHKLAPEISPKKTIEGAIGGLIGGAVGMVIFAVIVQSLFKMEFLWLYAVLMGLLGSALGQIGDLFFSIIKRNYQVKDYGNVLPGHGGILDRFDSVIFVAPFVELMLKILRL